MSTFARGKTTYTQSTSQNKRLWIAFKWVPLQEEKQHGFSDGEYVSSCELLSNEYLCKRKNNLTLDLLIDNLVVNCFQMSTFARGKTTWMTDNMAHPSCELLSNEYLCKRKNNTKHRTPKPRSVVNCFQMSTFARGKTTTTMIQEFLTMLWIAFKWVPLQEEKQQSALLLYDLIGCELLSNEYLCKRKNNVIHIYTYIRLLWIAFKWVPLQEEKQLLMYRTSQMMRCELLSNEYLCKRKNNAKTRSICTNKLWIAFKWVPLQEEKQRW